MALNPIETAPTGEKKALRGKRSVLYAGIFVVVGSAIVYGPSFIGDLAGLPANSPDAALARKKVTEASLSVATIAPQKVDVSRRDVATAEIPFAQQIDALRGEVARATAAVKEALERERQQASAVAAALTSLRGDVARASAAVEVALREDAQRQQTAQIAAMEDKQALEQERQRADAVAANLASARQEIDVLRDQLARAIAAADAARSENVQSEQKHKQALERERQRADTVASNLASARQEIDVLRDQLARAIAAADAARSENVQSDQTAQKHKQALDRERQRADALARDLASVREEVEALRTRGATTNVTLIEPAQSVKPTPGSARTEVTQPMAALPAVSPDASAERGLAAESETAVVTSSAIGGVAATLIRETPPGVTPAPLRAIGDQMTLWVKRGEEFIGRGDFASARQVFQRAADVGDAQAAFMLAATYDPNELHRFRTKGLTPDIAKARFWYEKARALGSPEAPRRLDLLAQPGR